MSILKVVRKLTVKKLSRANDTKYVKKMTMQEELGKVKIAN